MNIGSKYLMKILKLNPSDYNFKFNSNCKNKAGRGSSLELLSRHHIILILNKLFST